MRKTAQQEEEEPHNGLLVQNILSFSDVRCSPSLGLVCPLIHCCPAIVKGGDAWNDYCPIVVLLKSSSRVSEFSYLCCSRWAWFFPLAVSAPHPCGLRIRLSLPNFVRIHKGRRGSRDLSRGLPFLVPTCSLPKTCYQPKFSNL